MFDGSMKGFMTAATKRETWLLTTLDTQSCFDAQPGSNVQERLQCSLCGMIHRKVVVCLHVHMLYTQLCQAVAGMHERCGVRCLADAQYEC